MVHFITRKPIFNEFSIDLSPAQRLLGVSCFAALCKFIDKEASIMQELRGIKFDGLRLIEKGGESLKV
jgi:hypothetical protein